MERLKLSNIDTNSYFISAASNNCNCYACGACTICSIFLPLLGVILAPGLSVALLKVENY